TDWLGCVDWEVELPVRGSGDLGRRGPWLWTRGAAGSGGDWDRLAAFGHSVEDAPMAMEEVSSDPYGISNLTGLCCPANPEVGCCVQPSKTQEETPTTHPLTPKPQNFTPTRPPLPIQSHPPGLRV
ncbi:hypothetical protein KUCAC02_015875, partial [Chaenocephalus aceratus]